MKTYILNNNYDTEYSEGSEQVRFTLDELDVLAIINHARYVRDNNLLCVEEMDYRCEFLDDFRQETPRMAIFGDYIVFTGYQKHGSSNSEWSTDRLMLDEIAQDFGVPL